jgi:hypothetical protein
MEYDVLLMTDNPEFDSLLLRPNSETEISAEISTSDDLSGTFVRVSNLFTDSSVTWFIKISDRHRVDLGNIEILDRNQVDLGNRIRIVVVNRSQTGKILRAGSVIGKARRTI